MISYIIRLLCLLIPSYSYNMRAIVLAVLCSSIVEITAVSEVIWAVNCGGDAHVDVYGVHYQKDTLKVGLPSAHGRNIAIRRIPAEDQILYQTERYHTGNFAYDVTIKEDGDYVLVMKFSEVWFTEPNRKVFNAMLNNEHTVVEHLDIFAVAGFGMAHDEIIPFSVRRGKLYVVGESSKFDGTLHIEFVKLQLDNPKINAMFIMRGKVEDAPKLQPLPNSADYQHHVADDAEEEDSESVTSTDSKSRRRRSSESRISDPYAAEETSSTLIPVAIAIGVFIPLVFCLCKL